MKNFTDFQPGEVQLNMLPCYSVEDQLHRPVSYAELFCETINAPTRTAKIPSINNLRRYQFGYGDAFTNSLTLLRNTIISICLMVSEKKVINTNAFRVVAAVTNYCSVRNLAVSKSPRNPVGFPRLAGKLDNSIAANISLTSVIPAAIAFDCFSGKPVGYWN